MASQQYQYVIDFITDVRGVELPKEFTPLACQAKDDRVIYMAEELQEFATTDDPMEEVDAMIDLTYFAFGTLAEMGVTPNQFAACFNRVHAANMTKKAGKKAGRNVDGVDATKPEGWQEPTFNDVLGYNNEPEIPEAHVGAKFASALLKLLQK